VLPFLPSHGVDVAGVAKILIPSNGRKAEITMRATDSVYAEADFAYLYDHFNRWGPSDEFYLALARKAHAPVLDLGCGTGMAAVRLAAEGIAMTGADPAPGMLGVARARPGAERVEWIQAAGQELDLGRRFGLAYMTGHAFQALLTDEDAVAVLRAVVRHLAPGGRFAFETRNPEVREWLGWTPEQTREVVVTEAHGRVEETIAVAHDPATDIVDIEHRYRFLDRGIERRAWARIRFIGRAHVERLLAEAGLRTAACYGDWDLSPWETGSPEIIMICEKA
jgi:SAM-dependent methyltransferase